MKAFDKSTAATAVITHDVTPLTVNTDARAYSKLGWLIVLVGVCGFLIWATFAPLDKGVPLSGTVAKEGSRKTIQHMTGGTIDKIFVKDGDVVKAGQVLVRMNSVNTKSQFEITQEQYFVDRTAAERLAAERDNVTKIAFPASLEAYKNDPRVAKDMALQAQLFASRQAALHNEVAAMAESVDGLRAQLKGLEESRESKKTQLQLIKEELEGMRDLAKEGYIPRSRLLEAERTYAQVAGSISEDLGNIGHVQSQILEVNLRRIQREEEYQKDVRTQLADVQKEGDALNARLLGQKYDLDNAEVRAPVDGVVVGLNVFTEGGVVGAGAKMMELVPTEDALIVEGQLAVNLIDKVHTGLPVELIFSAFNANKTPHIPGVITQVSADRTVDERTGNAYYKVRARVTPEGAKLIAKNKLDIQSGMPVELFVKTGERTMMSYLLKPVFDRAKTSMTEE